MRVVPIIAGPTAAGKTALAVALALDSPLAPGEVISADAFQVYRGMDLGTGKPTPDERRGVPHHVLDVVEPTEPFTVSHWLALAHAAVTESLARGHTPIIAGGTHLYIKALLDGLLDAPAADEALRAELARLPAPDLRAELLRVDSLAASRIHPNDRRRTIRAIEVFRLTGRPLSTQQSQWDSGGPDEFWARAGAAPRLVILDWPGEAINLRINARVRDMFDAGLLGEVRSLLAAKRLGPQAREALGYRQIADHLEGRGTLDDALERTKIETRRFAKNQRTWLRRLRSTPGSVVLDPLSTPLADMLIRIASPPS